MTSPPERSLAVEVKADAKRGNINQPENVFSSLTQPLVCFGRAALRKRSLSFPFLEKKTGALSGPIFLSAPTHCRAAQFPERQTHKGGRFHIICTQVCVDGGQMLWWTNPGCEKSEEARRS